MSKIIGVTAGTPTSPAKMEKELKPVKTVNGIVPDKNGNVQTNFAYNFTVINKTSTDPKDAEALDYMVSNWGKKPMSLYVQGYPVIKVDTAKSQMTVLYNDTYISAFTWAVSANLQSCKLSSVGQKQLAEKAYVDGQLTSTKEYVDSELDKLVITGDTLTWDGNPDGHAVAECTFFGMPFQCVHVSDAVITLDDVSLVTSVFVTETQFFGGDNTTHEIKYADCLEFHGVLRFGNVSSVPQDVVGKEIPWGDDTITFPKAGTYFLMQAEDYYVSSFTIPGYVFRLHGCVATKDYIVEQGRTDKWEYRKWASGKAECWKYVTATLVPDAFKDSGMMTFMSYGLFWTRDVTIELPYPFEFVDHPVETACLSNSTVWFPLSLISTTHYQKDKTDSYRICTYKKPDQEITVSIAFHVVGKWK